MNKSNNHTNKELVAFQKKAFKKLYKQGKLLNYIINVSLRYTKDRFVIEEIASKSVKVIVERLWGSAVPFNHSARSFEDQVRSFIPKTVRNIYFNDLRERTKENNAISIYLLLYNQVDDEYFSRVNYCEGLEKILTDLQFLTLYYTANGKKHKEVAKILNIKPENVNVAVHGARKTARKYLKSIEFFNEYGDEQVVLKMNQISDKVGVKKRRIVEFYNVWKRRKKS